MTLSRIIRLTLLVVVLLVSPGQAKQAAPATPGVQRSTLGPAISFSLSDGKLTAQWEGDVGKPGAAISIRRPTAKLMVQPGAVIRDLTGESVFVSIARQSIVGGPTGSFQVRLPKDAQALPVINGQNLYTPDGGTFTFELSAAPGGNMRVSVMQLVQLNAGQSMVPVLNAVAKDFRQLAAAHPDEVRQYVAPVLMELTGLDCFPPGAGDVYSAFHQLQPGEETAHVLSRVLVDLDAEAYATRSAAARELAALGPAGVLAAMRADLRAMSAEQRAHVEGFIAAHTWQAVRLPAEAQRDVQFLLQCLAYPDFRVRSAAIAALAAASNRELAFDVKLEGDLLAAALESLQVELLDVIYPGAKLDLSDADPEESHASAQMPLNAEVQRQQIRQMRQIEARRAEQLKKGERYRLSELLEVRREGGLPRLKWTGKLMSNQPVLLAIEGSKAQWLLYRAGEFRKGDPDVMLTWSDFTRTADEGPWRISLNFGNEYMSISGMYGENANLHSVTLTSMNGGVSLTVNRTLGGPPAVQAQGATIEELVRQHPDVMRRSVLPMLRDLFGVHFQAPAAGEVYQAFEHIAPEAAVVEKLEQVLPRLEARSSEQREQAAQQLAGLGEAGVVAVMRLQRDRLSFEQNSRLNAYLAASGWPGEAAGAGLRTDLSFLLSCLEFEDPAVQASAKSAIEAIVGPVDFDLSLQGDARIAAIESLRQSITTKP